ncbi:hypothetical protein JCM10212_002121 [Sporobolomyces blumeae]
MPSRSTNPARTNVPSQTPPSPTLSGATRFSGRQLDSLECARPVDDEYASGHGSSDRRLLRIAIVTENFLPKVDGVTRTLAMLLEHLQSEGHQAIVLGPSSPLKSYAGHEVVTTRGVPLLGVYKGLGLNFVRPLFIRKLKEFKPDVIQFVDPIWLCAQTIPLVQRFFPDTPLVTSYHTNLAMYATLFGFSWLTPAMWALQRSLHGRCDFTFCPSPSTARMLEDQKFSNVRLWPRGVDTLLFRPDARDYSLRQQWGVEPPPLDEHHPSPRIVAADSRRSALDHEEVPTLALPPSYAAHGYTSATTPLPGSKLVVLYVGRISWEKNLRLLIEAFRSLEVADPSTGRPACQLVFVGDGPSRGEAEALCESHGLDARFLGFRKGGELAACYASADIFAFPSFTETFGQVVSEAQASGLPVVGLRAEGVCDLVEHDKAGLLLDMDDLTPHGPPPRYTSTGFKCLPTDPHSLVGSSAPTFPRAVELYRELLLDVATNADRRRSMGSMAHLVASKRSWHAAMEMLVDGYREVSTARSAKASLRGQLGGEPLSRTSTIEFDVVTESSDEKVEVEETRSRVPRLRRAFQRTKDSLTSSKGLLDLEDGEDKLFHDGVVRFLELAVLVILIYLSVRWSSTLEAIAHLRKGLLPTSG